jgi:hypothetical protein
MASLSARPGLRRLRVVRRRLGTMPVMIIHSRYMGTAGKSFTS